MIATDLLPQYLENFTYIGIILSLFVTGLGVPIPEDVTLILSGYMVYQGVTVFPKTVLAGFVGVIIGDITMYTIGRMWGETIISHRKFRWIFTKKRIDRAREYLTRYGGRTVFVVRFLTGIRACTHLTAGTLKMRPLSFLLPDIFAAMISVPLIVYVGYVFGDNIDYALKTFSNMGHLITVIVILAIIGYILYRRRKGTANKESRDG